MKDLSDWRYEGVIYKKTDDPSYNGKGSMYAPDVCLAPDGKYYLYKVSAQKCVVIFCYL